MLKFLLFLSFPLFVFSQQKQNNKLIYTTIERPKLVVGIVVDQMRYDYIYRYWNKFSNGGFKRLVNSGFSCENTNYNYVPTYTGPGHASIFTGSFPAVHGIIANEWYNKLNGKMLYCTEDTAVMSIGSSSKAGKMSPKNMLVTTIGDELKINTMQQSKVIAVSLKDRASILPAGHSADAAYWFDGTTGNFITSSHYRNQLPDWLTEFNDRKLPQEYLKTGWSTLLTMDKYIESTQDNMSFEISPTKKQNPVFPYDYSKFIEEGKFDIIRSTPFGNSLTKDVALAALVGEQLGKDDATDMLCVSFSSTDYIGHSFGPRSIEIEDTYLRLDLELEKLFNELDKYIGKNNYLLFLTADHGAAEVPAYLTGLKIPAGLVDENELEKRLKIYFHQKYADSLVLNCSNQQVFLNHRLIKKMNLNLSTVEQEAADFLLEQDGIGETYTATDMKKQDYTSNSFKALIQNGFHFKRSGDVMFRFFVAHFDAVTKKGTTHGAEFSYDTHVPLFFMGWKINHGISWKDVSITDIAPTICLLLKIPFPNGCVGKPITELIRK